MKQNCTRLQFQTNGKIRRLDIIFNLFKILYVSLYSNNANETHLSFEAIDTDKCRPIRRCRSVDLLHMWSTKRACTSKSMYGICQI